MTQSPKLMNRNFFLLWQGQFVSGIGSSVFLVAMALYIKQLTGSATLMGSMMMVASLPGVLLGPIAGAMADRFSRRKIIIITDFLSGLAILAFALLVFLSPEKEIVLTGLLFIAISLGILSSLFQPAVLASIPDIVPKEQLVRANSLGQFSGQISILAGQAIGAFLYRRFGAFIVCIINGISYIYSAISEIFITIPQKQPEKVDTLKNQLAIFKKDLSDGFRYVWNIKGLKILVLLAACINFFISPILILLPFYVEDFLHLKLDWYGVLLAASGIGSLLGFTFAGMTKFAAKLRGKIMMMFIAVEAGTYGLLGLVNGILPALALICLAGFLGGFVAVNISVTLQMTTPSEIRGRVFGLLTTLVGSITPIGMGLGGVVGDLTHHNIPLIYLACAIIMMVSALLASTQKSFRDYLGYDHAVTSSTIPEQIIATDVSLSS